MIGPALDTPKVPGETTSIGVMGWPSWHPLLCQLRKDGIEIIGATNGLLIITNLTPSDCGVYDATPGIAGFYPSQKVYLSVQTQNGEGIFRFPRTIGSNFIADFEGAAGRYYAIHWSTNLTDWSNLTTLTTTTGTAVFTNAITGNGPRYYRAMLLP